VPDLETRVSIADVLRELVELGQIDPQCFADRDTARLLAHNLAAGVAERQLTLELTAA